MRMKSILLGSVDGLIVRVNCKSAGGDGMWSPLSLALWALGSRSALASLNKSRSFGNHSSCFDVTRVIFPGSYYMGLGIVIVAIFSIVLLPDHLGRKILVIFSDSSST